MCDNNKKQKRSAISLETKIIILDCLAKGERSTAIGKRYNLGESTIRAIKKNEAAIRRSVRSGTNLSSKISSYSRGTLIEKTEKALVIWIEDLTQKRIPLDGHLIKMKALKFYKELKESEPSTSSRESNPQFSASTGWLTGFIKIHSFHNLKIKGEVASADEEAARKYPEKLAKIIKDGGYCAHIKSSMLMKQDCFGKKCQPVLTLQSPKKMPVVLKLLKIESSKLRTSKYKGSFFPPNTTSLIQPLDQGIISTFKKYYVKFTFQFIFDKLESDTITVTEVWKQFNILNCVDHVALAIAEIKSQTLNACWKAAWPECVSKRNESNRTTIVTSDIISIAKEIGGEGFDDFGEHDIEELLVDEALNDDDILESMVDTTKDFETVDSELEDVTPLDEKLLREGLQLSVLLKKMCDNNKKQKRSAISLETKIIILDCLAKGERSTAIGKRYNLGESTIRAIKKNEAAIRRSVRSGTNLSSKISSYSRGTLIEKTEKALVIWIEDLTQKRIPLDGHLIKMKALKFYKELKESEPSTSSRESNPQFSASTGWLTGFIKSHSFHNLKIKGEVASADEEAARKYPEKLAKIIKDGGYCAHQIFNADETGLFWKKMPTRTYIAKSEKNASGFKAAKDRVTLLLCSNASGDRMLKPLLVNRSLKPRALKGKDLNTLPVHWMANKKAWVTTAIFTEWFNKCFVPEVENYMKEMGLEFKILLILHNAPGHPNLEHPNIKVVFFPPNTTSLIQPLDQGIISTFKKYYVKFTFQFIFDKLESDTITVTEVWKQFNILNCVDHVALAIAEIKSQTLNACWKAAWPECVSKKNESNRTTIVTSDIISIAKEIGGEGFDDFGEHDIEELLVDEALNDDDILESMVDTTKDFETVDSELEDVTPLDEKLLRKGLQLSGKLENFFIQNDNDVERALKFQRDLKFCMSGYRELYKELVKPSQRLITDYLVKEKKSLKFLKKHYHVDLMT
ncbi:hypothetical protein LAZ67_1005513 [Cordylochernes scorpioides]|uniref:HTH CENPB-type domain-containing protein n=1 Tax=Cordylochernes scorpioides TaxID=51811 RepID=A0ABY6K152_9ARAC|nr:hypothetical protein LAZ67_1005513 [Cordylochernes scorpioides]